MRQHQALAELFDVRLAFWVLDEVQTEFVLSPLLAQNCPELVASIAIL